MALRPAHIMLWFIVIISFQAEIVLTSTDAELWVELSSQTQLELGSGDRPESPCLKTIRPLIIADKRGGLFADCDADGLVDAVYINGFLGWIYIEDEKNQRILWASTGTSWPRNGEYAQVVQKEFSSLFKLRMAEKNTHLQ